MLSLPSPTNMLKFGEYPLQARSRRSRARRTDSASNCAIRPPGAPNFARRPRFSHSAAAFFALRADGSTDRPCCLKRSQPKTAWIHRQVLLPVPCYDLTKLHLPGLASLLPTPKAGSRQLATTGVDAYDGQCEQVPGTYSARFGEARLREVPSSRGPFQPAIPTTRRFADLPAPSGQPPPTRRIVLRGPPRTLDTLRTYLRPPHLPLARPVPPCTPEGEMAAWVSSIHGLNQKITPSTSGGHAQSQVQSSPGSSLALRGDSHAPRPW